MFIKAKNTHKEDILINTDNVEMILRQSDNDVFIYLASGEHIKLSNDRYDQIAELLSAKET